MTGSSPAWRESTVEGNSSTSFKVKAVCAASYAYRCTTSTRWLLSDVATASVCPSGDHDTLFAASGVTILVISLPGNGFSEVMEMDCWLVPMHASSWPSGVMSADPAERLHG